MTTGSPLGATRIDAASAAQHSFDDAAERLEAGPLLALAGAFPIPLRAAGRSDEAGTWAEELVHRARNLTQLAISQGYRVWSAETQAEASRMSQAYAELDGPCLSVLAPCHDLLNRVATSLAAVFGQRHGGVGLLTRIAPLDLPPEQRRALVLIASELVLNALKHACPDRAGMIRVTLDRHDGGALLAVEDDGPGAAGRTFGGEGSRLVGELAGILRGTVERETGRDGGLTATVSFPHCAEAARPAPNVTS